MSRFQRIFDSVFNHKSIQPHTIRKLFLCAMCWTLWIAAIAPTVAFAGVAEDISNGGPIAPTITALKNAITDITRQIEATIGISQFRIRQSLQIVLDDLNYKLSELEGKTFRDIKDTQHRFFLDAEITIQEARRVLVQPLSQAEDIAIKVENAAARIPGADKVARIHHSSPTYILQSQKKQVHITVAGSELNHGQATLQFYNEPCVEKGRLDTEITFLCDLDNAPDNANIETATGQLVVPVYQSAWSKFVQLFKDKKNTSKQYSIMIQVLPMALGSYEIVAKKSAVVTDPPRTRTSRIQAANGHCDEDKRHGPFLINRQGDPGTPTQEWVIVPGSIRVGAEVSGNQGRNVEGPQDVSSTSFVYYIRLTNGGRCILGGGDSRAELDTYIHWDEVRTHSIDQPYVPALNGQGTFMWGTDIPIDLTPQSTFTLTVKQFDKKQITVFQANNENKWFRVDVSPDNTKIVLRPRPVAEALK